MGILRCLHCLRSGLRSGVPRSAERRDRNRRTRGGTLTRTRPVVLLLYTPRLDSTTLVGSLIGRRSVGGWTLVVSVSRLDVYSCLCARPVNSTWSIRVFDLFTNNNARRLQNTYKQSVGISSLTIDYVFGGFPRSIQDPFLQRSASQKSLTIDE